MTEAPPFTPAEKHQRHLENSVDSARHLFARASRRLKEAQSQQLQGGLLNARINSIIEEAESAIRLLRGAQ